MRSSNGFVRRGSPRTAISERPSRILAAELDRVRGDPARDRSASSPGSGRDARRRAAHERDTRRADHYESRPHLLRGMPDQPSPWQQFSHPPWPTSGAASRVCRPWAESDGYSTLPSSGALRSQGAAANSTTTAMGRAIATLASDGTATGWRITASSTTTIG